MAGYKPQANLSFVGVYVAKEKRFFDVEGLDVTIEHSSGKGEHLQFLVIGKVKATTQDAAVLLKQHWPRFTAGVHRINRAARLTSFYCSGFFRIEDAQRLGGLPGRL